ncbi:MAG: hypothetical protein ABJY83_13990 [Roseibium sp.]
MPKTESEPQVVHFYTVRAETETGALTYEKSIKSPITDNADWVKALNFRQRCDNAIFRTNVLLNQLSGEKKQEYKARRSKYLEEIVSFARAGLENGDIDGADSEIETFEAQFVAFEGPIVRHRFLSNTLLCAVILGLASLFLGLSRAGFEQLSIWNSQIATKNFFTVPISDIPLDIVEAFLFIYFGCCLGVALAAFTRNLNMTFENLGSFDAAGLRPGLRFTYVGVLSFVLAVFLYEKIFKVCLGTFCLDETFLSPDLNRGKCIIIGIICGLADIMVTRVLSETINKSNGRQSPR